MVETGRLSARWMTGLFAAVALLAFMVARADAAPVGSIGRANLDGSSPNERFVTAVSAPAGVAANQTQLFWPNVLSGAIGRTVLGGGTVNENLIPGATEPLGIAIDATYAYWTNSTDEGTIGRAGIDGLNADQSFISGASDPVGVAVDNTHIYWTNSLTGTIGRANIDGTSPDQNFITGGKNPAGIAVSATHIYWADPISDTIGRANLDGSEPNQAFIRGTSDPLGVAVDDTHIFWTNSFNDTIGRAKLDGTAPKQNFITGASDPAGVAVNATHVFWANASSPLPPPVFGKKVNLRVVEGTVLIRLPGAKNFVSLQKTKQVPIGSSIDARKGRLEITAAKNLRGNLQLGQFYEGRFSVHQIKGKKPLIELRLIRGKTIPGCPKTSKKKVRAASIGRATKKKGSSKPHLWGDAKGNWRTKGKGSATTIRGTIWLVEERCNGTYTRVRRGVVDVVDFLRKKTVKVRAGRFYLAHLKR